MNSLKNSLMMGLLPLSLLASISAWWFAIGLGWPIDQTLAIVHGLILFGAWALERAWPYRADWNQSRGDLATDAASAITLAALVQPLLKYLLPLGVVSLYALLPQHVVAASQLPWQARPLALQVLLALLVVELAQYAMHRIHHTQRPLWWLHALHHSSERQYALNGLRVHPLEYMLRHTVATLPLMLLGAPPEVLFGVLAITQPVLILQHANLPLRHGWLNFVLSTNALHRWHHSDKMAEANSNYGSALIIWDHVFGSYRAVAYDSEGSRSAPERIGLFAGSAYPARASVARQIASIFTPNCCR